MKKKSFVALLLFLAALLTLLTGCSAPETENEEVLSETTEESFPLTLEEPTSTEEEEEKIWEMLSQEPQMRGIDVSKWQGKPNWQKIAQSGVEFAMLRVGYHGTSGAFGLDECFLYNVENAHKNGVLIGVYFYSLAESVEEAKSEALWVLEQIREKPVSMPVVIDYEMMENDAGITATVRTDIALAFLKTVKEAGYTGMLYAPVDEFEDPTLWEKERILDLFFVWGADYNQPVYPEKTSPEGDTPYAMWQYSNTGRVEGIAGNVDQNVAYFSRNQ